MEWWAAVALVASADRRKGEGLRGEILAEVSQPVNGERSRKTSRVPCPSVLGTNRK